MAVSLRRQARGGFIYAGMLARMPVGGGAARELLDGVFEADWSPDGRQLMIVREEQGTTRIEYPMGTPIYRTSGWVSHVRVSPKGDRIAFLDHPTRGDDMGSVCTVDLAGEVEDALDRLVERARTRMAARTVARSCSRRSAWASAARSTRSISTARSAPSSKCPVT